MAAPLESVISEVIASSRIEKVDGAGGRARTRCIREDFRGDRDHLAEGHTGGRGTGGGRAGIGFDRQSAWQ